MICRNRLYDGSARIFFINLKNSALFLYYHMADTRLMEKVLDEIRKEEEARKKKKKKLFSIRKEKRLQYYSGWHKDDGPVNETKEEQKKLS